MIRGWDECLKTMSVVIALIALDGLPFPRMATSLATVRVGSVSCDGRTPRGRQGESVKVVIGPKWAYRKGGVPDDQGGYAIRLPSIVPSRDPTLDSSTFVVVLTCPTPELDHRRLVPLVCPCAPTVLRISTALCSGTSCPQMQRWYFR